MCRICERIVPELELEKHSKFCALGHEYRVKLSVLDKKLKKYAIILASRRKLIKEVCIYSLSHNDVLNN